MSSFTGTAIFGVSTGGNPLPISVGAGANRMVIALAGHNRSDGHFEQMFINGVPGREEFASPGSADISSVTFSAVDDSA